MVPNCWVWSQVKIAAVGSTSVQAAASAQSCALAPSAVILVCPATASGSCLRSEPWWAMGCMHAKRHYPCLEKCVSEIDEIEQGWDKARIFIPVLYIWNRDTEGLNVLPVLTQKISGAKARNWTKVFKFKSTSSSFINPVLTNYKAVLKSVFASSNIRAMFCLWARRGRTSCIASIHVPQQYWPVALLPEALEKSNIGKNLLYFDFLFREGSLDSVISLQSSLCKQSQKQQTVALKKKKKSK